MKKFTLSFFMAVVLLFAYNVMAQTAQRDALYFEDFESFNVGDHIAQVNPDWWRTWGDSPGTAEDAVISDEQSLSGTKSLKFTGDNDNLVKLGNKIAGEYELSWNVFIPVVLPVILIFNTLKLLVTNGLLKCISMIMEQV